MPKLSIELKSALWGAFAGAVASGIMSFVFDLYADSVSQQRAARLQMVMEFSGEELQLPSLGAEFIDAVTTGKKLDELKLKIRGQIAEEIRNVQRLRPLLGENAQLIDTYQETLQQFAVSLDAAKDPTKMSKWAENFGKVIDARQLLDEGLRRSVGV